jgi:outer membrane murein-binding lipoprotein Lpp
LKGRYEDEISDLKERIAQYEKTLVDKNVLVVKAQEDAANANQRLKQETE